jgi:hypothetical protein
MTDVPVAPGRRDNLYEPVEDDGGERGRYGGRVANHSLYTHSALHPRETLLAASAIGLAFAVGWRASRRARASGGEPAALPAPGRFRTEAERLESAPPSSAAPAGSRAGQTPAAAAIDLAPEARR